MTVDPPEPEPPDPRPGPTPGDDAPQTSSPSPATGDPRSGSSPPGWGPTINTGLPASLLPGVAPWEDSEESYGSGPSSVPSSGTSPGGPAYRPYDPSVGPPWPVLVANPGYAPPRLIRWPIYVGVVLLVAELAAWLPSLH
jgi:hypothetical protein